MANRGILAWALASAGLMIVGAFGPWAKVLAESVNGTDGSNDGWIIAGIGLLGGLLVYAKRESRGVGFAAIVTGLLGAAGTLYDRHNLTSEISHAGPLGQAMVQVGWGLNLALAASVSLAIAGLASFSQTGTTAATTAASQALSPMVPQAPPAGWYRDPQDPSALRYWSGTEWTSQTATPSVAHS